MTDKHPSERPSKHLGEHLSEDEAGAEFWKHLENTHTVMLGLMAPGHFSQPMTAFVEKETCFIWFFTSTHTDLAHEAGTLQNARLIFIAKDHEVHADVIGTLTATHDSERIERYWNPAVATFYPEGKNDPHITLLCFSPTEGRIWVSKHGMMRMAFEMAKANMTKSMPNVGSVTNVHFRH